MFLRARTRRKDGKQHRYWSVVENRRVRGGRVVQRQLLHLGELNDSQRAGWVRTIETLTNGPEPSRQLALFPDDRGTLPELNCEALRVRVDRMRLCRPRQFGACWLALHLWNLLGLDEFWASRLPPSRKGTRWGNVLQALVAYRLIDPAASFVSIANGTSAAPWRICSARTSRWRRKTSCIGAWTCWRRTAKLCSNIFGATGASCSRRSSTCCCMT